MHQAELSFEKKESKCGLMILKRLTGISRELTKGLLDVIQGEEHDLDATDDQEEDGKPLIRSARCFDEIFKILDAHFGMSDQQ